MGWHLRTICPHVRPYVDALSPVVCLSHCNTSFKVSLRAWPTPCFTPKKQVY